MKFNIINPAILHRLQKSNLVFITFISLLAAALIPGVRAKAASTGSAGDYVTNISVYTKSGQIAGVVYANSDVYTYKVPIYLGSEYFTGGKYVCGLINFDNIYTFKCGGRDILPNYFESAVDVNTTYVTNFRVMFNGSFLDRYYILIGYFVFNVPVSEANQSFIVNPAGETSLNSFSKLFVSNSYQNLVNNVATAINNSSDIDTILEYLSIIKNNAPLINDVLSELETHTSILYTLSSKLTQIYNKDVDLYNLIYNYINNSNNGASAASQAAADLAGAASEQHAAEASLAALSPGNMSDLDQADGLAVLDNVTNATRFWSTLVTKFSEVSGILWGVFIIALLLGLIAFILRLR